MQLNVWLIFSRKHGMAEQVSISCRWDYDAYGLCAFVIKIARTNLLSEYKYLTMAAAINAGERMAKRLGLEVVHAT